MYRQAQFLIEEEGISSFIYTYQLLPCSRMKLMVTNTKEKELAITTNKPVVTIHNLPRCYIILRQVDGLLLFYFKQNPQIL